MIRIIVDKIKSFKYKFELKINKISKDGCWIWIGCKSPNGYGFYCGKRSHRVSYELYVGKIPKDKLVCHTCDNPSCVNPSHLWIGTIKENNEDRDKKGRFNKVIGEKHGKSKLTVDLVIQIKKRIIQGEPMAKIARELELNPSTVANIKYGLCWSHVKVSS